MNTLRLLLALWLSLSVPTVALASLVNADHCQRAQQTSTAPSAHAQHADMQMQGGDHAQHRALAGKAVKSDNSRCDCGCNCSNTHCATSGAGFMAVSGFRDPFNVSREHRLIVSGPADPVAAHPLDLLRPPSKS